VDFFCCILTPVYSPGAVLLVAVFACTNAWALLRRRRVARPLTVFSSLLLLIGLLLEIPDFLATIKILNVARWVLIGVALLLSALYGLWLMLSKAGKDAFEAYVLESRP
jgi:hypothetical protein